MKRVVVGAVLTAFFAALAAIALGATEKNSAKGPSAPPLDRASLERAADAATGEPGKPPPICPERAVANAIKAAGIPVGPCIPVPDDVTAAELERIQALAAEVDYSSEPEEPPPPPEEQCGGFIEETDLGAIVVKFPCGTKFKGRELFASNGEACMRARFVEHDAPNGPEIVRTYCGEPEPTASADPESPADSDAPANPESPADAGSPDSGSPSDPGSPADPEPAADPGDPGKR